MIEVVRGPAAQANVASQPANVLIYGPPGTLKTTDAVTTFTVDGRCKAFFIPCEDGALKSILSRGLPIPDHPKFTIKTWTQMEATIGWLNQNRNDYTACIIDGFTPFASYIYTELEQTLKGTRNKYEIPTRARQYLFNLREWIRMIGLHSIFIAHADPPTVSESIFYPGCFKAQPRSIVREYFGQLDTVLRVDYLTPPGQQALRVYHTGGEIWPAELPPLSEPTDRRQWLVKNREGCNQAVVPANLGAFLRSRVPPYTGV